MGQRVLDAAVSALTVLGTLCLPIVGCCLVLSFLAWWQNRRLLRTFGWKSLLVTGWLGTPVHELSHAAAAVLFAHRVREIKLFQPNPATGQLGLVRHTYNPRNLYASVLGNAFIPVAPLFGGTAAMLLVTLLLMPGLVRGGGADESPVESISSSSVVAAEPQTVSPSVSGFAGRFLSVLLARSSWTRWQFYVYLYIVFCIAMHLAPSRQDFSNFLQPAVVLTTTALVVAFLVLLLGDHAQNILNLAWRPFAAIADMLMFAIAVSLAGTALVTLVTAAMRTVGASRA